MGVYVTSKCPNCKFKLKNFEHKNYGKFGTPIIRCSNCGQIVKTGKKLWRDMSFYDKIENYMIDISSILFLSLLITIPITLIILYFLDGDINKDRGKMFNIGIPFYIILFVIFYYRLVKSNRITRKNYEEDFDNQEFKFNDY